MLACAHSCPHRAAECVTPAEMESWSGRKFAAASSSSMLTEEDVVVDRRAVAEEEERG